VICEIEEPVFSPVINPYMEQTVYRFVDISQDELAIELLDKDEAEMISKTIKLIRRKKRSPIDSPHKNWKQ
jgi:hypothetical protein